MATIWAINPRRKRRSKRRSAAQRAATRRMLAANRSSGAPRRRRRRSRGSSVSAAPRRMRRVRRSYRRRSGGGFSRSGVIGMLKNGAIAGGGAVAIDLAMGQVASMLATSVPSLATPQDSTTGGVNYGYYGLKAGLAVALGIYGKRILPAPIAEKMAEGALTVLAYQFIRPMVPASFALGRVGYVNPSPTFRRIAGQAPGAVVGRVGKYLGAYTGVPVRAPAAGNRGAGAASVLRAVGNG